MTSCTNQYTNQDFNQTLIELLQDLGLMLPQRAEELVDYVNQLELLVKFTPSIPWQLFYEHAEPYADELYQQNDRFFLEHEAFSWIIRDFHIDHLWTSFTDTDRAVLWQYALTLYTIAKTLHDK